MSDFGLVLQGSTQLFLPCLWTMAAEGSLRGLTVLAPHTMGMLSLCCDLPHLLLCACACKNFGMLSFDCVCCAVL